MLMEANDKMPFDGNDHKNICLNIFLHSSGIYYNGREVKKTTAVKMYL